jgi:hypothetical protein
MALRLDAPFWIILVAFTLVTTCVALITVAARAAGMVG